MKYSLSKSVRAALVTTALISSLPVFSSGSQFGLMISPLKVKVKKTIDPVSSEVKYSYKVDDVDIELTKKDRIKAKNWNLEPEEWAKYKYIMEYKPRGLWTPNLDPPIVLSVESVNQKEKMRYAKLANEMERDRQVSELNSTIYSIHDVEKKLGGAKLNAEDGPKNEIEEKLGVGMLGAMNIFVSPNVCKNKETKKLSDKCNLFITLTVASTPSSYALTIYHKEGTRNDVISLLENAGVTKYDIERKNIEIKKSEKMFKKFQTKDLNVPFWISQNDKETKSKSAF